MNKMKENEIKDAYNKNDKLEVFLPELNDDELDWAGEPRQTAWVYNKLKLGIGNVWVDNENGYSMQVIDRGFRLLSVVNHEWPLKTVAFMMATLSSISHDLEVDIAIVIPYIESPEGQIETENNDIIEVDEIGLEVA